MMATTPPPTPENPTPGPVDPMPPMPTDPIPPTPTDPVMAPEPGTDPLHEGP